MSICFCKPKALTYKYIFIKDITMKKYIFLFAFISVLVSIILHSQYSINNTKQSMIAGNKFYKVLFFKKDVKLLEKVDSNWKHLANFESAFNHILSSRLTNAASVYSDMVDNKDIPDVLRELAQYLEVMCLFYYSKKINEDKINNLGLSVVYPYSSQEAIAIIKIHNNDIKGAVKILHSLLNDRKCPTLIKANAEELLQIYEK
ncbi:hypothetical protein [Wolbachia endosymbiont of Dirofilaria (Dirofilaria) immitis]|uniref:hypothetical protein n=1 Tax=Wolbachia endosymbiont of Dirofilaria (Dirofilaria) immitis TaxID=1812115 RepID=UPI00158C7326|nr:hypothetical protein [Wolbachia endosymbiont of Dirofilaria (Dirofilaria) immitis]QKX02186.1 hypothetical protein GOY12_01175 [Wolbachia endosymbiont of Dirofilaria (Dirofilaria) immitis]